MLIESAPRTAGFSLLELMITLLIAGIIWLVTLPLYQQAVLKAGRASARAVLMDVLGRQEQFLANNNRYATLLPELGLPERYFIDRQAGTAESGEAAYEIELQLLSSVYFGVAARPQGLQSADEACGTLRITASGERSAGGAHPALPSSRCWQ